MGDHVAPGREVKRRCGAGRKDVDHGARRWVFDLFAQAQQERGAEQSGAVDGEVGWGYRAGGP